MPEQQFSIGQQAQSIEWTADNLVRSTKLREQLRAAAKTLWALQAVGERLFVAASTETEALDGIAEDVVSLLGLPTEPVVNAHGNGKHTAVPEGRLSVAQGRPVAARTRTVAT